MTRCSDLTELLVPFVDGELDAPEARRVEEHLAGCEDCRETVDALRLIADAVAPMSRLEPPTTLARDLASSPCHRWMGLLFAAVDREIGATNLERLLTHLESCEACRQVWNDLSTLHQAGEALEPPPGLAQRCAAAPRKPRRRPVLGARTATAAAYVLAVLTTLLVGNPVSLARNPASDAVQRVAASLTEQASAVAEDGRGEVRVMLWRALQWGERKAVALRDLAGTLLSDDEQPDSDSPDDRRPDAPARDHGGTP